LGCKGKQQPSQPSSPPSVGTQGVSATQFYDGSGFYFIGDSALGDPVLVGHYKFIAFNLGRKPYSGVEPSIVVVEPNGHHRGIATCTKTTLSGDTLSLRCDLSGRLSIALDGRFLVKRNENGIVLENPRLALDSPVVSAVVTVLANGNISYRKRHNFWFAEGE
jgi:hypothetical protein